MLNELSINSPHKDFESIKKIDEKGVEYWTARELMTLLGYLEWRSFEEVIQKANRSAVKSNQTTKNHLVN